MSEPYDPFGDDRADWRTTPIPVRLKRQNARELLLAGMRPRQVAERCGVTVATVYRWIHEPRFAARLDRMREAARVAAMSGLTGIAVAAVEQLARDLHSENEQVRRDASRFFLSNKVAPRLLGLEGEAAEGPTVNVNVDLRGRLLETARTLDARELGLDEQHADRVEAFMLRVVERESD